MKNSCSRKRVSQDLLIVGIVSTSLMGALITPKVLSQVLGVRTEVVHAADTQVAPSSVNVTLHKLMYSTGNYTITNNGEVQSLPNGTSPYDPSVYGAIQFTAYDITSQFTNGNGQASLSDSDKQAVVSAVNSDPTGNTYVKNATSANTVDIDGSGNATFSNLKGYTDGTKHIYLIVETKAPKSLVAQKSTPLVIATPMTNSAGTDWLSNIQLYPKNQIATIKLNLNAKVETDGNMSNVAGAKFQLYKGNPGSGTKVGDELTTDSSGNINISGLTKGDYYAVQTGYNSPKANSTAIDTSLYILNPDAQNNSKNRMTFSITDSGVDSNDITGKIVDYKAPTADIGITNGTGSENSFEYGATQGYELPIYVPKDIAQSPDAIGIMGDKHSQGYDTFKLDLKPEAGTTIVPSKENITIKSGSTTLVAGTDYTVKQNEDGTTTINFINSSTGAVSSTVKSLAGNKLTVTANAVGKDSVTPDEKQNLDYTVTFSNGSDVDGVRTLSGKATSQTDGAKFVTQTDGLFGSNVAAKAISGAKFVLQNGNGQYYNGLADTDNDGQKEVQWVSSKDQVTNGFLTSDDKGQFNIKGIKNGTYTLTEVSTPDGVTLRDKTKEFTVKDGTFSGDDIVLDASEKGTLPVTGSFVLALVLVGGTLTVTAYYLNKKRKENSKNVSPEV